MGTSACYTEEFFQEISERVRRSAEEIVPIVLGLVQPKSVIDIGCGEGLWLSVFRQGGVTDVIGIDGPWVNKASLKIPEEQFLVRDIEKPLRLDREFDLVVSLEVAEHVSRLYAETFVESLTRLGPVVLFSAAIPHQGGTNHVNEQWPDYWASHFRKKSYSAIDCLRKRIWTNHNVEWWYAQNLLIFARDDYVENHPRLRKELELNTPTQLSVVHPNAYLRFVEWRHPLELLKVEISTLVPAGELFIFVDEDEIDKEVCAGRCAIPFLERNGEYWGPPPDDETAIRELDRLRRDGAKLMVFAWPSFWWLDYYSGLHDYLNSTSLCVLRNDRLVVFDLRRNSEAVLKQATREVSPCGKVNINSVPATNQDRRTPRIRRPAGARKRGISQGSPGSAA